MVRSRTPLWGNQLLTLFPRGLENTALSPTLLNAGQQARRIINLLPNDKKAGSGAMRYGMGARGPVASSDHVDGWEYRATDGTLYSVHYMADGSLRRFDGTSYTTLKTGMAANGLVGALQFNGKLIVWNGIDPAFAYDGTTCTDLGEYVVDYGTASGGAQNAGQGTAPTWVSASSFTIKPGTMRTDYPNGRPIRVTFATAGTVAATVASTSYNAGTNTLTVNVTGTPFPATTQTILRVEYFDKPPPFSFLYAENDILFGLSSGESRARVYRATTNSMKVYYQTASNNENAWFSQGTQQSTQNVAFINIQNKARVFDELVGISSIDSNMVFHGRQQLYIYSGYDPNTVGDFVWAKTVPVGTLSGKLILKIPSDIAFVSPSGIVSLRRVFQTEAAEVVSDIGSDIDPTIDDKLVRLTSSDADYRRARAFYYQRDGLIGFKLDAMNLMVYVLNEKSKGWVEFSGYFTDCQSFVPLSEGRLLIGRGTQLYAYANGTDPLVGTGYADGTQPISCEWWLPWQSVRGSGWGNRAFTILLEESTNVTFYIDRFVDFDESNPVVSQATVQSTGTEWDMGEWDTDEWDGVIINPTVRDKFLADEAYSARIYWQSTTGPVNILGLRPLGR